MTTKILFALLTFAMMTSDASARASGHSLGRSSIDSAGTVTNYDSRGRVISRETVHHEPLKAKLPRGGNLLFPTSRLR